MDDNKTTTGQTNWLSKSTLRDWGTIISMIFLAGGAWVNFAANSAMSKSQMDVIAKELGDVKTILKEMQNKQDANYNNLDKRTNDNMVGLEVVKARIENIERTIGKK